ncbi:hypothetical protein MSP5_000369 [Methylosinus sporium]|nr:hypothetical protein [Methylosinus sporium]
MPLAIAPRFDERGGEKGDGSEVALALPAAQREVAGFLVARELREDALGDILNRFVVDDAFRDKVRHFGSQVRAHFFAFRFFAGLRFFGAVCFFVGSFVSIAARAPAMRFSFSWAFGGVSSPATNIERRGRFSNGSLNGSLAIAAASIPARESILEALMLRAVERDLASVLAIAHPHSERDVISRAELMRQPSDAMHFIGRRVLMTGHCRG